MNKSKFISFAFALLLGAFFVSCSDDDDVPAYEYTKINDTAASAGLYGNVKSVETISYDNVSYDSENNSIIEKEPYSKRISRYDEKGVQIGLESYGIFYDRFRLNYEEEYQYDNRYREILYLRENYAYGEDTAITKSGSKRETIYDDSKKTATISEYYWSNDDRKYVLLRTRIHPLNPNGTVDSDVYTEFVLRAASAEEKIEYEKERIVLEVDANKNWTKAYSKFTTFNENGEVGSSSMFGYQERTIVYY